MGLPAPELPPEIPESAPQYVDWLSASGTFSGPTEEKWRILYIEWRSVQQFLLYFVLDFNYYLV